MMETLTSVSSPSVLPSTPIGEHGVGKRTIKGSCFWLHVVSSTEILLRQSLILKWPLVHVTNSELSTLWQYPESRTTWMRSFVLTKEHRLDNFTTSKKRWNLLVAAMAQQLKWVALFKRKLSFFISGKDKFSIFDEKRWVSSSYVIQVKFTLAWWQWKFISFKLTKFPHLLLREPKQEEIWKVKCSFSKSSGEWEYKKQVTMT